LQAWTAPNARPRAVFPLLKQSYTYEAAENDILYPKVITESSNGQFVEKI
jgi:hypothetical protein